MPATLEPPPNMTVSRRSPATSPTTAKRIVLPNPKAIAVVNSKGGVGKTTISTLLALELAALGYTVRFLDCDKQASSSTWLAGADAPIQVTQAYEENVIHKKLPLLLSDGCVVIMDGPAKADSVNRMLMCMADIALLPCGPSVLELDQLEMTVDLLSQAKDFHMRRKGLPLGLIVPNQLEPHKTLSQDLMTAFREKFNLGVLPSLHARQAYKEAAGQQRSVTTLGSRASKMASEELSALVFAVVKLLK